jgi:hypothetical protein
VRRTVRGVSPGGAERWMGKVVAYSRWCAAGVATVYAWPRMSAKRLGATDAMFLYAESRETMLHVASLMPFTPPADAPPDHSWTAMSADWPA